MVAGSAVFVMLIDGFDPSYLEHGLANGTFLDDKKFWPIYERADIAR